MITVSGNCSKYLFFFFLTFFCIFAKFIILIWGLHATTDMICDYFFFLKCNSRTIPRLEAINWHFKNLSRQKHNCLDETYSKNNINKAMHKLKYAHEMTKSFYSLTKPLLCLEFLFNYALKHRDDISVCKSSWYLNHHIFFHLVPLSYPVHKY